MRYARFGFIALLALGIAVLGTGCPAVPSTTSPTAQFTCSAHLGDAPITVAFTNESEAGSFPIKTYAWDFGDGTTSTLETPPAHVYATPGTYTISLTVTDSRDNSDTDLKLNTIAALDPNREEGVTGEIKTFAGINFVWIPAGTFQMGTVSDDYPQEDSTPVHEVTLTRGFWISQYEITQDQWKNVIGFDPSFFKDLIAYDTLFMPVEQVTWNDCQDYVSKLNQLGEGVFRLPTEAEWEYACRAGSDTEFCFGDNESLLPEYAWYWLNAPYQPFYVGLLHPNAWGLYDMHGNVEEWVQDNFGEGEYYESSPAIDPAGEENGPFRVVRGGAWRDPAVAVASPAREPYLPSAMYNFIGLRLVRQ